MCFTLRALSLRPIQSVCIKPKETVLTIKTRVTLDRTSSQLVLLMGQWPTLGVEKRLWRLRSGLRWRMSRKDCINEDDWMVEKEQRKEGVGDQFKVEMGTRGGSEWMKKSRANINCYEVVLMGPEHKFMWVPISVQEECTSSAGLCKQPKKEKMNKWWLTNNVSWSVFHCVLK